VTTLAPATTRSATNARSVAILGLGYVGLPLAVRAAMAGHTVTGFDVAPERIAQLDSGVSPVEDVPDDELKHAVAAGLRFTTDPAELAGCDTFVVCVPTPLADGAPDLSMVLSAVDVVAASLAPGDLVVLESTTYPGTTEELVAPRIAALAGLEAGRDYHLAFSPERIDPANPSFGLGNTPKVVGGLGRAASSAAAELYGSFIDNVHVVSGPRVAEMAKLLENTFRHVNIALVNEMAVFCHELGIDLWEAIDAAATKPFGFMPFRPGPGVGGHCIPIDPSYLSWRVKRLGYSFRFVELACEINERMPDYVAHRIADLLNQERKAVNGARVLLLGVAYKRDVADLRESSAFALARRLAARGAEVDWQDPHVETFEPGPRVGRIEALSDEALAGYDLVVIHTDHSAYDWDWIVPRTRRVLDTRNATAGLDDPRVARL
jgi:UDP-N-acetyl-D-glucosamine dehydrogenase